MKIAKHLSAAAVVAALAAIVSQPALAGSADVRFSIGDVSIGIDVGAPPPAPVVEYVPVALPGHLWVPGYWAWNGHRHVWNQGAWEKARPGYHHIAGHWQQRGDRWHFEPSRWEAHSAAELHRERREYAQRARYEDHHDHASSSERHLQGNYSR